MRVFGFRIFAVGDYFPAFLYACFVLFLGFSAAASALSFYYADAAFYNGSEADAAAAVSFQPQNPDAHKTRGMVFLRHMDYEAAADAFEQAAALRQNDFLLWLRLGYCRLQLKNFDAAQAAYEKALVLAPNYSQPNYYFGSMLLETARPEQAFQFLSKAAEQDNDIYPEVLNLARTAFPGDPLAIERAVWPASVDGRKTVAGYFIEHGLMTDTVRSFLTSDELSEKEKNELVRSLIYKQNFQFAREVWLSRSKTDNGSAQQPIFDGGFENITDSDESGLGWQIAQNVTAFSVARDNKVFHSGSKALEIKFAGNVDVNKPLISQLAYLEPHRKYQLRFFYRSTELISAGLPLVVISDGVSGEVLGRSAALVATDAKWLESRIDFTTGGAPVALISFQRTDCPSPCPIFGEVFLDDFSVIEN